jgi:ATP-dependent helicase/nuclease subunit B
MKTVTVRPAYGTHPRLHILGLLEARMIDADLIIMAGLNEKSWPPDTGHDPWMSRPMRRQFGLPGAERGIGLSAHDFVQGFCASHVIMTRSVRQDGAPSVPARWLQRLDAVLEAAGLPKNALENPSVIKWVYALDKSERYEPVRRPEPRPPVVARPRSISATQVEKWQQDPYSIYARSILRLKPLKPLEKPVEAAEKGDVLHETLKKFVQSYPMHIPENAAAELMKIAASELEKRHDDPSIWSFWQHRFEKTADWLAQHEKDWRETAIPAGIEIEGKIELTGSNGSFTLYARADRIDAVPGGAAIIDYKSGGDYPEKQIATGKLPQLPLEGLILSRGGFEKIGPLPPLSLQYWKLTGGKTPGEVKGLQTNIDSALIGAESGLLALIGAFADENTPYYSIPRPENAPRFNDYKHLARISEWAVLGDDDASEVAR